MNKKQAGRKGGETTVAKHGREHMAEIGTRGAKATWTRYALKPVNQSQYVMVDRRTNEIKAIINYLPERDT
jgi:general stress protein YciG